MAEKPTKPTQLTTRDFLTMLLTAGAADPEATLLSALPLIFRGPKAAVATYTTVAGIHAGIQTAIIEALFPHDDPLNAFFQQTLQDLETQRGRIQSEATSATVGKLATGVTLLAVEATLVAAMPGAPARAAAAAVLLGADALISCGPPTPEAPATPTPLDVKTSAETFSNLPQAEVKHHPVAVNGLVSALNMRTATANLAAAAGLNVASFFQAVADADKPERPLAFFINKPGDQSRKDIRDNSISGDQVNGTAYIDFVAKLNEVFLEGRGDAVIAAMIGMPEDQRKAARKAVVDRRETFYKDKLFPFLTNMQGFSPGTPAEQSAKAAEIGTFLKQLIENNSANGISNEAFSNYFKLCFEPRGGISNPGIKVIDDLTNNGMGRLGPFRDPLRDLPAVNGKTHFLRPFFALPAGAFRAVYDKMNRPQQDLFISEALGQVSNMSEDKMIDLVLSLPAKDLEGQHFPTLMKIFGEKVTSADKAAALYVNLPETLRIKVKNQLFGNFKWEENNDEFIMAKWLKQAFMPIKGYRVTRDAQGKETKVPYIGYDDRCVPMARMLLEDILKDKTVGSTQLSLLASNYAKDLSEKDVTNTQALWQFVYDLQDAYKYDADPHLMMRVALANSIDISVSAQQSALFRPWRALNHAKSFMGAVLLPDEVKQNIFRAYHLDPFVKALANPTAEAASAPYRKMSDILPVIYDIGNAKTLGQVYDLFPPDQLRQLFNFFDMFDNVNGTEQQKLHMYQLAKQKGVKFSPLPFLIIAATAKSEDPTGASDRGKIFGTSYLFQGLSLYMAQAWDDFAKSNPDKAAKSLDLVKTTGTTMGNPDFMAFLTSLEGGKYMGRMRWANDLGPRFASALITDGLNSFDAANMIDLMGSSQKPMSELASRMIDELFYVFTTRRNARDMFGPKYPDMYASVTGLLDQTENLPGLLASTTYSLHTPEEIKQILKAFSGKERAENGRLGEVMVRQLISRMSNGVLTLDAKGRNPNGVDPRIIIGKGYSGTNQTLGDARVNLSQVMDIDYADLEIVEITPWGARARLKDRPGIPSYPVRKMKPQQQNPAPAIYYYKTLSDRLMSGQTVDIEWSPSWGVHPSMLIESQQPNGQIGSPAFGLVLFSSLFQGSQGIEYQAGLQGDIPCDIWVRNGTSLQPRVLINTRNAAPAGALNIDRFQVQRAYYDEKEKINYIEGKTNINGSDVVFVMKLEDFFSKALSREQILALSEKQKILIGGILAVGAIAGSFFVLDAAFTAVEVTIGAIAARIGQTKAYQIFSDVMMFLLKLLPTAHLNEREQREYLANLQNLRERMRDNGATPDEIAAMTNSIAQAISENLAEGVAQAMPVQKILVQGTHQSVQAGSIL